MRNEVRGIILPDEARLAELEMRLRDEVINNEDIWRIVAGDFAARDEELPQSSVGKLSELLFYLDRPVSVSALLQEIGTVTSNRVLERVAFNYEEERYTLRREQAMNQYPPEQTITRFNGIVMDSVFASGLLQAVDTYDKERGTQQVSFSPAGLPRDPVQPQGLHVGLVAGAMTAYVTRDFGFAGIVGAHVSSALPLLHTLYNPTVSTRMYAENERIEEVFRNQLIPFLNSDELVQACGKNQNTPRVVRGFRIT